MVSQNSESEMDITKLNDLLGQKAAIDEQIAKIKAEQKAINQAFKAVRKPRKPRKPKLQAVGG